MDERASPMLQGDSFSSLPALDPVPMQEPKLTQLVEALLFSSPKSLTLPEIAKALHADKDAVKDAWEELGSFYRHSERAFGLQKLAGGYLLATEAHYKPWITQIKEIRPLRLSAGALETLAIIAYKQPITKADMEEIRGVDASYAVKSLLDKGLIRIAGRKEIPGRPLLYCTNRNFLEVFGFKSLGELPRPEELDLTEADAEPDEAPEQLALANLPPAYAEEEDPTPN